MKLKNSVPANIIINLVTVYICYWICRGFFFLINRNAFDMATMDFRKVFIGGTMFDLAAIAYTNIVYILLETIPAKGRYFSFFDRIIHFIFILVNSCCICLNLSDAVYYQYTRHHLTAIVFEEFKAESNLLSIAAEEGINSWYLIIAAVFMIWLLQKCYIHKEDFILTKIYYLRHFLSLPILAFLTIFAIRGGSVSTATRPISMNDAMRFSSNPSNAGLVLNAPFCMIRTIGETTSIPHYFSDEKTLNSYYQPIHFPSDSAAIRKKNIVILIVESLSEEFVGSRNKNLEAGNYCGYTPFIDSLLNVSLSFKGSFSNSGFSIDAMPAVLASIPRMDRPYVVSPYSLNHIRGIASLLEDWGYESAFFHGAENTSLGFQSFARTVGYHHYYGRTEYYQDSRFNAEKDFDGIWAIWDEEYLQHFCMKMNDFDEPFITTAFTASSHHPFAIPERYKEKFPDDGQNPMHKCIKYTDNALRQFFNSARSQSWYNNTIFVITADHASSLSTHEEYKTEFGHFRIPILFFDPSEEMPRGCLDGVVQQIDIMPTLLGWLGYDKPFFAFGENMLNTKAKDSWAMNWDHYPQFITEDYLLTHNGHSSTGLYRYREDPFMRKNLISEETQLADSMSLRLEAFMQTFFMRMQNDSIIYQ